MIKIYARTSKRIKEKNVSRSPPTQRSKTAHMASIYTAYNRTAMHLLHRQCHHKHTLANHARRITDPIDDYNRISFMSELNNAAALIFCGANIYNISFLFK